MKSRLNKKADVSPAFQYIFALVVGAIILIFFIRFAFQAEKSGTEVIKAEVLHMLDASLQAFSVSTYSTDNLPKPPWPQIVDMKVGTKANCGKFTVTGQKFLVPIPRIVFGPEEMKARQLQAWTNSWHFPFRITNMFYLVNDRSKYYLIYDANSQEFVRKISSYPPETAISEGVFAYSFSYLVSNAVTLWKVVFCSVAIYTLGANTSSFESIPSSVPK